MCDLDYSVHCKSVLGGIVIISKVANIVVGLLKESNTNKR